MKITSDDIYALLRRGESISVEMKKCSDKLPRSVWETYSAFANSRGGMREVVDVKEVWLSLPLVRTSKSEKGTSNTEISKSNSTVNSTVESTFGSNNHVEGQANDDLGQERGQENCNEGQINKDLGQVNSEQGQVNEILGQVKKQEYLSDKQKEILIYLLKHPSESLKNCSDATGASAKSIRYTFQKVSSWLDIHHEGPDKTGIWRFKLIKND